MLSKKESLFKFLNKLLFKLIDYIINVYQLTAVLLINSVDFYSF